MQILQTLGDQESEAIGRLNLAVVAIERRQTDAAHALLGQALQVATALGSQQLGQSTLDILAGLCAARAGTTQRCRCSERPRRRRNARA